MKNKNELPCVVIKFSGDSGDGMQITGEQFSATSASMGNDISTFPDYPSEIRAPSGTVAGVSGFQVHIGATEITTPGDEADTLVAMNLAALKSNMNSLKRGGTIILNTDSISEKNLEKLGFEQSPLDDTKLKNEYNLIPLAISSMTLKSLETFDISSKDKERCKNFYALGFCYFLYNRKLDKTIQWLNHKFNKNIPIRDANITVLKSGFNHAETVEATISTFIVPPAKITPGIYKQVNGNTATAWGLIKAAQDAQCSLFLGSYPITPATDVLHELTKHQSSQMIKTFQAEDEIAGICSAIGASLAGSLAVTTTSGPGMALKTEALGLATVYETPLVIINVQRGGPSTGLPTKTEQSDLFQAMYGRNGEAPIPIIASARPSDCFETSYIAAKIALEYMTPVILLSDGYIGNGSEPWKIPDFKKEYGPLKTRKVDSIDKEQKYPHMKRDPKTLARTWVIPGQANGIHRLGGLEKDYDTGDVSYEPKNHERMVKFRQEKIQRIENDIPLQKVFGKSSGDTLVVSWGGTFGAVQMAAKELMNEGYDISHIHLRYINPFPKNLEEILKSFQKIIVPELNLGQLKTIIDSKYNVKCYGINKIQGQPFKISELKEKIINNIEERI